MVHERTGNINPDVLRHESFSGVDVSVCYGPSLLESDGHVYYNRFGKKGVLSGKSPSLRNRTLAESKMSGQAVPAPCAGAMICRRSTRKPPPHSAEHSKVSGIHGPNRQSASQGAELQVPSYFMVGASQQARSSNPPNPGQVWSQNNANDSGRANNLRVQSTGSVFYPIESILVSPLAS